MEAITFFLIILISILAFLSYNCIVKLKYMTDSLSDRVDRLRQRMEEFIAEQLRRESAASAVPTHPEPPIPVIPEPIITEAETESETGTEVAVVTDIPQENEISQEAVLEGTLLSMTPPPLPSTVSDYETEDEPQPQHTAANTRPAPHQKEPEDHGNGNDYGAFERLIGVNLFSKIGIFVLVLGIGFFVKYAIDNNWINEVARTALGLVAGFALWGVAFCLRKGYRSFSSILAGGGFAVCLTTVTIAYNFYSLFNPLAAFLTIVALTVVMGFIAMKWDRREIAMVAIIGGYAAPFLADSPDGSFAALCAYVLLLDCAIFVLTIKRGWWELPATGCFLTYLCLTFCYRLLGHDYALTGLIAATLYFLVFSVPLVTVLNRNGSRPALFTFLVTALLFNDFAFLGCGLWMMEHIDVLCHIKGGVTILIAAINAIVYFRLYRKSPDRTMQNILIGLVIVFSSLYFPTQYSGANIVLTCLAVDSAVLLTLFNRTRRTIFLYVGGLIAGVVAIALLLPYGWFEVNQPTPFPAKYLWTYLVSGAAFAGASVINRSHSSLYLLLLWGGVSTAVTGLYFWLYTNLPVAQADRWMLTVIAAFVAAIAILLNDDGRAKWFFPAVSALSFCRLLYHDMPGVVGQILTWGSVCMVVVSVIAQLWRNLSMFRAGRAYAVYSMVAYGVIFIFAVCLFLRSVGATHLYSAGVSAAITVCGAAQMFAGMRMKSKALRLTGLCSFGIVIVKLALHDLWRLPTIGRIVVFILLGVILLLVSFLYQRLRKAIFNDDQQ